MTPALFSQTTPFSPSLTGFLKGSAEQTNLPTAPHTTSSFQSFLKETSSGVLESVNNMESLSQKSALGLVQDTQSVSLGVMNASLAVRQITHILSTALQSYKEIERMQI